MNVIRVKCLFTTLDDNQPRCDELSEYAGQYNDVRGDDLDVYVPLNTHQNDRDSGRNAAVEQARHDLALHAEMTLGKDALAHLGFEWSWCSVNPHGKISGGWMVSGDGVQFLAPVPPQISPVPD